MQCAGVSGELRQASADRFSGHAHHARFSFEAQLVEVARGGDVGRERRGGGGSVGALDPDYPTDNNV